MNAEQLSTIEEMAYQLFTPSQIALILEVDCDDFLTEVEASGTPVHKAYYSGYLRQLSETRRDTIKAARNGSNPAQVELCKFIGKIQREVRHG